MHEGFSATYAYLLLSTSLLVVWLILYGVRSDLRRQLLGISLGTMPLGLTEPLFVPAYWNPPTVLDLARRTGFDLESLLFSFAIGGIVFAAYEALTGTAPAVFLLLFALTSVNPIYGAAVGLVAGFLATLYCRPDLWAKMLVSGALFLLLYFAAFAAFNFTFPGYAAAVWNLPVLSRVFVAGVPLEELMFAFTFGLYWSSVYEHLAWKRGRRVARTSPGAAAIGSAR